jgi:F-type H+-transporting ATPase subunit b
MAKTPTTSTTDSGSAPQARVFPPLDPSTFAAQLVWLAVAFALLYVLLKRFVLPRMGEVLEERQRHIRRDVDCAAALNAEIGQALAAHARTLSEAHARGNALAKDMRDKLAAELDAERARAESHIARKVASADAQIARSKAAAMSRVEAIATDAATAIVAKLIGKAQP